MSLLLTTYHEKPLIDKQRQRRSSLILESSKLQELWPHLYGVGRCFLSGLSLGFYGFFLGFLWFFLGFLWVFLGFLGFFLGVLWFFLGFLEGFLVFPRVSMGFS